MDAPWRREENELVVYYNSSTLHGLSNDQVESNRGQYGENKLKPEEKDHIVIRFLEQFKDPLIMMLLGSVVLSVVSFNTSRILGVFLPLRVRPVWGHPRPAFHSSLRFTK